MTNVALSKLQYKDNTRRNKRIYIYLRIIQSPYSFTNQKNQNQTGIQVAPPQIEAIRPQKYPDRIGIWKCWFLRRGENRSTWGKTFRAEKRTNNKLNPHMASGPRIDPEPHLWEASVLTTAPSQLTSSEKRYIFN